MEFENLGQLFDYFENESGPFYPANVDTKLSKIEETEENKSRLKAERLAFGFYANLHNENNWGTYFGPKFTGQNEDGQWVESPSIKFVDNDVIEHWIKRAGDSKHPTLKIRYNDLVWDLTEVATGEKPDFIHAKQTILATIELINEGLYKNISIALDKLDRALNLSLSVNNPDLQEKVKDIYFKLFEKNKEEEPHLYNHLFKIFIEQNNSVISEQEEEYIIEELEAHLKSVHEKGDLFEVEKSSLNLAYYYRANEQLEDSKRVLKVYQDAIDKSAENNSALTVSTYYKKLYDKYSEYGFTEEADEVSGSLQEAGLKSIESMGKFEHEFDIPKEEIQQFVNEVLSGELKEIVRKIIYHFLPQKGQTEKLVKEIAQKSPFQAFISQTLQDKKGRIIAEIGSVQDDLEGRTFRQIDQNMAFEAYFLRMILSKFFEKEEVTTEKIAEILSESPIYDEETLPLFKKGMQRYLEDDLYSAIHIFTPLIEKCLRKLLEMNGGAIYRPGRHGGIFLRNLDEILRDQIIVQTLSEDIIFYLNGLLSDQRAWNLRNKICHGILDYSEFTIEKADRLFHALLMFSLIQFQN